MKKFYKILLLGAIMIGMIIKGQAQDAFDPTGERTLKVGSYSIGTFDAPDQYHLGTVISTRQAFGITVNPMVTLKMVVTSSVNGQLLGYIKYSVPRPGLVFDNRAYHVRGDQLVTFTAKRTGNSYIFDFSGNIKFFTGGQDYNFDAFDGLYTTSSESIPYTSGLIYNVLVLSKSGESDVNSKDRKTMIKLDTVSPNQ